MKKSNWRFITIIFIYIAIIHAQNVSKRWLLIEDAPNETIYIDQSRIKNIENQLTVWQLVIYKAPVAMDEFHEKIKKVKAQLIFNTLKNRYSTIGTLFYNVDDKIVGETNSPTSLGSGEKFSLPVQDGSPIAVVLQKTQELLTNGSVLPNQKNIISTTEVDRNDLPITNDDNVNTSDIDKVPIENPSPGLDVSLSDENEGNNDEVEDSESDDNDSEIVKLLVPEIKTRKIFEERKGTAGKGDEAVGKSNVPNIKVPVKPKIEYDVKNEKIARGNIWTDGNQYSIQVSSFRKKSVAQGEVDRLKRAGHNAFIVEAYVAKFRRTYNRVRIGYFDSLQEARQYQRKIK